MAADPASVYTLLHQRQNRQIRANGVAQLRAELDVFLIELFMIGLDHNHQQPRDDQEIACAFFRRTFGEGLFEQQTGRPRNGDFEIFLCERPPTQYNEPADEPPK